MLTGLLKCFVEFEIILFFAWQNVLRELEQKKPQLDELVHTAENLKADSNRQQLHGKGEYSFERIRNASKSFHFLLWREFIFSLYIIL